MRRTLPSLAAALLLLALPALSAGAAEKKPWEATLFAGYRGGGQFEEISTSRDVDVGSSMSYGLAVGRWLSPNARWDVTWSGQSSSLQDRPEEVRIDHLHWTGYYEPTRRGKPRVYVLLSAGLTRLASDVSGADDEIQASGSAGVGVRVPLSEDLSLRFEGRGWAVITSSSASVFCSGGCALSYSGSGFFQVEGSVGVSRRF